jgi:hypothetical protein
LDGYRRQKGGEMMDEKETRKRNPPIKVWCLSAERAAIEANAKAAGLSLSTYLRNVGMGYEIRGVLDHQRVDELARISADLCRLGGLLELWLTNDEKLAGYTLAEKRRLIHALLDRMQETQDAMLDVVKKI